MGSDQFCLKWNNYQTSMVQALEMLKMSEELVDVTLSCEGRRMSAHKIILSACSQYFKDIFKENPCQHPVVILKDVRYIDLESLVKYMYAGQVYIAQDQLGRFLKTAETLQVKGLAQNPFISSSTDDAQCERMRNEERNEDERMKTVLTKDEDEDDDEDD
ncbi:longitudinals lacking protein-like, partial [Eurytemora carolleeae]|uniref:longitudinals lacking protein-like n=1 Tax=Eurytemora carolleeae TaxID=1294199 RepID=UPI000C78085E